MVPENLKTYAQSNTVKILRQIGFGIHGDVFTIISPEPQSLSAAKVFRDEDSYAREKLVYERLKDEDVRLIDECNVPSMLHCDDSLWIIQMNLVKRPFCLDFASAYLDGLPDYFPEFDQHWHEDKAAQFGEDIWPKVQSVLSRLESIGIFQTDVSPSNICVTSTPP